MAVYIDGLLACNSYADAKRIEDSFKTLRYIHNLEDHVPREDNNHIWWISFIPKGIGFGVPYDSPYDRARFRHMKATILSELYGHLRSCSGYKLALFGWEIGEGFSDTEYHPHLVVDGIRIPEEYLTIEGLVIAGHLLKSIPTRDLFTDFSPGYHWIPKTDGWKEFEEKEHVVEGQVVADCGSLPAERTNNGGLTVLDGDTAIGIINFGRNSTLADLGGIRGNFIRSQHVTPQFGGRNLPEVVFSAGNNRGFKYVSVGPDGKTTRAGYILEVCGGCVVVQMGTDAESFDEHKYEESMLPTIRIE